MGLMNQAEKQRFLDHIKEHYRGCPICSSDQATLLEAVGLPSMERTIPDGIGPGSQLLIAIPIICKDCGHIELFGARGFVCEK